MVQHFIFGYGSLICPQSRAITAPTLNDAIAEPVVINNIERVWSARVTNKQARLSTGVKKDSSENQPPLPASDNNNRDHIHGWTPMGVRMRDGAKCNGVLIHVSEEELMRFDVREAGYERKRIDLVDIHRHIDSDLLIDQSMSLWPNDDSANANGNDGENTSRDQLALEGVKCSECRRVFERGAFERRRQSSDALENNDIPTFKEEEVAVWIYIQNENFPAERSFPITQSYIDIIMRGCLSISHDFARRFLETTHGWWHNGEQTTIDDSTTIEDTSKDDEQNNIDDHHTWVNDRLNPMYVRADSEYSMNNGQVIDELINEHHPHALKRRVMSM